MTKIHRPEYHDDKLLVCWSLLSLVPLSPPSWTFSLHDAPAKQKVSWRTPPTPPTVSSSSYPQVDGTGVSEPAPPDCSTAFSPRLWEPWTHITLPLSETPNNTPPPPPHLTTSQEKLLNFYLCGIQVSGPAQATCSNTLPSACTRHFHTPLCVHNPTKDWL